MRGAWHSPSTLPTMVHGFSYYIESAPLSANQEHAEQICGFESWDSSPVPSNYFERKD